MGSQVISQSHAFVDGRLITRSLDEDGRFADGREITTVRWLDVPTDTFHWQETLGGVTYTRIFTRL